ncbi:hypothetical protein ElyMa_006439500 [Elysia marginata]|uniref:Mutator-like transposase domain-containing protein n=1 Tax=Elysia marginata TaxID=1093978 RepID=A0AAV4HZQ8_9GAST|nr:hypothetical protein ElyMa_006439500 [Elysia marginata]
MPPTKQRSSKIRKSSKTALRQKMASITAKRLSSNPSNVPSPASDQTPEPAQPATPADLPATQAETAASWNHDGTAGYMEICGAVTMWGRSLQHKMRYTQFVGDGDAKTIAAVNGRKFYGDVVVTKEECVNHVSKRLNAGLRKLVSSMSKQNVRLGGNKKGSLTAPKIGLLQSFYTTAVRTYNASTEVMSNAIWAAFYHSISTPDHPQHERCPAGEESWCFYQRALVKKPKDASEFNHEQSTFLNAEVAPHVYKVYERLTDSELLSRCLLGKTQNANESLHSVIWSKCPKHLFSGLARVQIGATIAVGEFNMGSQGSHLFFPAVGCPLTAVTTSLGQKRDKTRIRKADTAHEAPAKRRRELRKLAQQKAQQSATRAEGGPSYVPGGF